MSVRATYRLQLNGGFTFADAEAILPYLEALGISHLYVSPVTVAQPGSAHGYDVIDPTRINPELGGDRGFRRLAAALRGLGMGMIIDIVPNHMSVTGGANAWWNDVLAKGKASPFARFFDIDWGGKILLPFLAGPLDEALAKGDLTLERDSDGRLWVMAYGHDCYPVRGEDQAGGDLAALLERQHYRLASWRSASEELNWRRFFTITGLAGIRVEDEAVFEATHGLYFRLYDEGLIDGVRVDHVDGLAEPGEYCRRLRARMPAAYIFVEKILAAQESLAPDWGVDGTTGYDFMEQVSRLLHHPRGEGPLADYWANLSGRPADFFEEELIARREILAGEFGAQLRACARAFGDLCEPAAAERLQPALERLLHAFPTYRTYGAESDQPILESACERAEALGEPDELLDRLLDWLSEPGTGEAARRFRQLSSPLAAKAVEDTAFYRFGRLLSRNDVGFHPECFAMGAEAFHRAMMKRSELWPRAMLATATHDHKRGEDVRARLAVLSELSELWIETAEHWRSLNRDAARGVDAGDEYQLYQMMVGSWPTALGHEDADALSAYRERLRGWMEKAWREARLRSSWNDPDEAYERRCRDFLGRALNPARSAAFLRDLERFVHRIAPAGEANSLVQTYLRCVAPGVPDCYQGCEFADLSMVDPDNRRAVDFGARAAALETEPEGFDATKQHLISDILRLRRERPLLWSGGSWNKVDVEGPRSAHVLAFTRRAGEQSMLGAVVLHGAKALIDAERRVPRRDWWGDTRLRIHGSPLAADLFTRVPVHLSLL